MSAPSLPSGWNLVFEDEDEVPAIVPDAIGHETDSHSSSPNKESSPESDSSGNHGLPVQVHGTGEYSEKRLTRERGSLSSSSSKELSRKSDSMTDIAAHERPRGRSWTNIPFPASLFEQMNLAVAEPNQTFTYSTEVDLLAELKRDSSEEEDSSFKFADLRAMQQRERRADTVPTNQPPPAVARAETRSPQPVARNPPGKKLCCQITFYIQLVLGLILAIVFMVRGFLLDSKNHYFLTAKWLLPLLSATGFAGISAFAWLGLCLIRPKWILVAAFCVSPLLTSGVGVMFIYLKSGMSLVLGVTSIYVAIMQALYGLLVFSRFNYGMRAIARTTRDVPPGVPYLVGFTIIGAVLYSSFLVCGIGGAAAFKSKLDTAVICLILSSLTWTMHVTKNCVHVLVARLKYVHFTSNVHMGYLQILNDMVRDMMGNIILGSALIPISTFIGGSARGFKWITGGLDEFLCSCTDCYSSLAVWLTLRANRWDLVHVGVYKKDFIHASAETLTSFNASQMDRIIDTDLTGVFCFFCGLIGGATSALLAGYWALRVHRSYAIELSLYAFLIGYFLCRIVTAWPQASIAAYYVSFANGKGEARRDSLIQERIEELNMREPLLRLQRRVICTNRKNA